MISPLQGRRHPHKQDGRVARFSPRGSLNQQPPHTGLVAELKTGLPQNVRVLTTLGVLLRDAGAEFRCSWEKQQSIPSLTRPHMLPRAWPKRCLLDVSDGAGPKLDGANPLCTEDREGLRHRARRAVAARGARAETQEIGRSRYR